MTSACPIGAKLAKMGQINKRPHGGHWPGTIPSENRHEVDQAESRDMVVFEARRGRWLGFLCLWDINNNPKITQKGKRDVEGNVKICLPATQRILIVPQYM